MDTVNSINFLSFLVIILIAVIVSKKARKGIETFVDFVIRRLIFLFKWGLIGVGIVGIISLFIVVTTWGWKKLHEIYPNMWSFGEIMQLALFLFVIGIIWYITNYFDKKLKNRFGENKIQKIYDYIGKIFKNFFYDFLGCLVIMISIANVSIFLPKTEIKSIYYFFAIALYLVVKYTVLFLLKKRTLRKKRIKNI